MSFLFSRRGSIGSPPRREEADRNAIIVYPQLRPEAIDKAGANGAQEGYRNYKRERTTRETSTATYKCGGAFHPRLNPIRYTEKEVTISDAAFW